MEDSTGWLVVIEDSCGCWLVVIEDGSIWLMITEDDKALLGVVTCDVFMEDDTATDVGAATCAKDDKVATDHDV